MAKKHRFVWDGRGERGEDARLSIMAGRAATDRDLKLVHFRVLAHLGRFNHKKGWCRLSQDGLAEMFGVARETVNRAVKQLVEWRYLEKQTQEEAGESFCLYRVVLDHPDEGGSSADPAGGGEISTSHSPDTTQSMGGVSHRSHPPDATKAGYPQGAPGGGSVSPTSHMCDGGDHTRVTGEITLPAGTVLLRARVGHIDHVDKKERGARFVENLGTDGACGSGPAPQRTAAQAESECGSAVGASGERLPFTADVLREIASLGVDVLGLIETFAVKTRNVRVKDPSAYLLQMGRQAAAKQHGVTADTLKAIATRDRVVRATELAAAVGFSAEPSPRALRTAAFSVRSRGGDPEAVVRSWRASVAHKRFRSAPEVDGNLDAFVAAWVFNRRCFDNHQGRSW
jgi:hypothetical protein